MAHIAKTNRRPVLLLLLCCLIALEAGCAGPALQTERTFTQTDRTYLVVQPETLNLRSCPERNCQVTALLYKGEIVAVRRFSGEWSEIETKGGGHGWVASHFLGAIQSTRGITAEPLLPEEELATPRSPQPPEIRDELAVPGKGSGPVNSPPAISEEFGQ